MLISVKIKISLTYVYREFEIRTNMTQEQLIKLKMKFLLGYNMAFFI